jgi:hypothetical protein
MKYWTWAEIREKVQQECDLEDEDFVRESELLSYANEAIDEAEAEIHSLYEDYFSKSVNIPVTDGLVNLNIPATFPDIYADKFRRVVFSSAGQGTVYVVNRLKDRTKFEQRVVSDTYTTTDLYQYLLENPSAGNPIMTFVPSIRETGVMNVSYIRNANRLVNDTDVCDIPEFINFIFSHMKVKVYGKEGHPGYPEALERLERERERMVGVLASRVPDTENEIELDTSAYQDMN